MHRFRFLACLILLAIFGPPCFSRAAAAEPTAEEVLYWWQDELRTVAFGLGRARTGGVAEWPQMSVPAGSAVLPLPRASGPIQADGKLDEPAWKDATTFPVGPVFDDWRLGPMMLTVRACRDDKNVYLAVEAPRDLTALGSLAGDGAWLLDSQGRNLVTTSEPGRVGPGQTGRHAPAQNPTVSPDGRIIELALPLHGDVNLSFAVETLRRPDGKLPAAAASIGLRSGGPHVRNPLWLRPITVKLVPADAAVQLAAATVNARQMRLSSRVVEPGKQPATTVLDLSAKGDASVYPYAWKATAAGKEFTAEGGLYQESVADALDSAREIARRAAVLGSAKVQECPTPEEIAALEAEAKKTAPQERAAWRALYCRARELRARAQLCLLDAPLLFVKQHPYFAGHIYDTYLTWHPGGGIYVLEEPWRAAARPRIRTVIDGTTNQTLGDGVYRDPDISWDARRLLFACKPSAGAMTNIYEIGIDGAGLRRLTNSDKHQDISPAYLPDGRVVFTSSRPKALVPCFNSAVDTLHTMNADGSDIRSISANNVTEFDPAVMPDGRILYGRWEYVDKTALYIQSLWTMSPDGRMEEALFANNLTRPTAVLDARPVPGSHRVIASLTPHNGQPVGAIATIDTRSGKNNLDTVVNFTPEYPIRMDQGLATGACDPWPLGEDDAIISNNALGAHGIIELVDRFGCRELVHCDPAISCYAPMLVKPRERPPVVASHTEPRQPGRFLVADIYEGLEGIPRGSVKRIRVLEETARTSGIPPGGRWWNQAFLVSWQGAYIVKNILGTVPVEEDGSAYFELPPGRALYFEALDGDNREVQRMRTFVQAAPGVTRSCVGCHETRESSPLRPKHPPLAALRAPSKPQPESWGSGYLDYPTMVQPVLDRHCVRCHGGAEGIAKGIDLSGGWTWAFNISYESLIKHRLVGYLNCENSRVHTAAILRPRSIGSGAAPLAEILVKKHPELSPAERDVVLAWMDTNSNYYGTWDHTQHATCNAILAARAPLAAEMKKAGCTDCHAAGHIGNDWINLQTPELSRILRAPLAKSKGGLGVAFCRDRKARSGYPLVDQSQQPPDVLLPTRQPPWDDSGEPRVSFTSTDDPHYRAMLAIIRQTRAEALSKPRIDMPGAVPTPGECRLLSPMPVPQQPPAVSAKVRADGAVELAWQRTAETIGLQYELHRGAAAGFAPGEKTQIGLTTAGRFVDPLPPAGTQHYALIVTSGEKKSLPAWVSLVVPEVAAAAK